MFWSYLFFIVGRILESPQTWYFAKIAITDALWMVKASFKSKFISRHAFNRQNSFQIMCQKWKRFIEFPCYSESFRIHSWFPLRFRSLTKNIFWHIFFRWRNESMTFLFTSYILIFLLDLYIVPGGIYSYNSWLYYFNAILNLVHNLNHFNTKILIAKLLLSPG